MANENAVRNLIRIDDKENPTLFRALQLMIDDLYKVHEAVFPTQKTDDETQTGPGAGIIGPVLNFIGLAYPDNLRLDWDILLGAFHYQIKMGDDWDLARPVLITASDVANVDPVYLDLIYGTYVFILRPMDANNILGLPAFVQLTIPVIGSPDLQVEGIVSTVLLRWTEPLTTWRIDHYIVYKNGQEIGTIRGTFKLIQEQVGGTYSYSVRAVDTVGNLGAMSAVKSITLSDPSEFAFIDSRDATYLHTYVNTERAIIDNITGVLGPRIVQTWKEHYEYFGFTTIQEQVNSGFPFYYQPALSDIGFYEELFDFGSIHKNIKIVADHNKLQLFGSTNIVISIRYSEDGTTWVGPIQGESLLATSFRYVIVTWAMNNVDSQSQAFISGLRVVLSVTLTLDSGSKQALASDVGGTLITYNKTFIGINSVTATPSVSLQPLYAVCDNVTPVNFRVLVFDSSGNRKDASINWKARGIV